MHITLSEDKFEAFLSIPETDDRFPSAGELRDFIAEHGIVYGLDEEKLAELIGRRQAVDHVLIAKGRYPDPVIRLNWHIRIHESQRPRIDEKNRADFKQLQGFSFVHKGQRLVSEERSDQAEPGMTVTGESVAPQHMPAELPEGPNTVRSEDGQSLFSAIDGIASWHENRICIEEVYHIRGNVDYHTGNIKFRGPVIIEGDVRSGFRVESTESIFIDGTVGAAHIYAQSGDITITCGILGKKRAKILAGGSLKCGFVQDATVGVKEDVLIDRYALNSTISAGGRVVLAKNEGLIRGGSITAELGIIAREVGSTQNVFTELKLRSHSEHSSQQLLWDISKKRTNIKLRQTSLSTRQSFLKVLKESVDKLSEEKLQELERIRRELTRLQEKITELDKSEIDFQKKAAREALNREVKIFNMLFRNVRIDISGKEIYIDEPLKAVKVFRFKDDIVVESLADLEDRDYDIFVSAT